MGSSSSKTQSARTPFPDSIADDAGAGFVAGATVGSAFHCLRGLRSSPAGHRLAGAAQAVRANAPRVAGAWTGFFLALSAVESAMLYARGKDDQWNTIVAFASANGLRSMRRGPMAACRSALAGAAFWGLVEVYSISIDHVQFTRSMDKSHRNRSKARLYDGLGHGPPAPAACSDG